MHTDRFGNTVTAADPQSVEAYDRAVGELLHYADPTGDAWEATVVDDPGFALGHIGRAYLRCLSSEGPDAAEAAQLLVPLGSGDGLLERERAHLDAARAYAAGDLRSASERLARLSVVHPRDVLALVVGHQLDFFMGASSNLRDRIARALLAWDERDDAYGLLLGMVAFGLEECGRYEQAEAAGREALDRDPRDVWALHAVAHTFEMRGRFQDGISFMDERRGDWTVGNFLSVHNWWHEGLFRLEAGDTATPLHIYDTVLHHEGSAGAAMEMLDASAMLWRLHLEGADVGGRWGPLADAWAAKVDGEPWYVFNDAHAMMAFVGAGRMDAARALVARLAAYAAAGPRPALTNVAMVSEVGLPVCSAMLAFGEGRYGDVVELLHPIRNVVHRFGGSHAQRDAVARTLLEAALRAGDTALARALVSERLLRNDGSPFAWRQLARVRRDAGDDAGAAAAEAKVAALR